MDMKGCCPKAPEHFAPLLGYCDHQIQKLMEKELRQYGVSPMQCHTLTYLYKATHEVNQKMLQDFLMVKPSTVNGIVDRLEEKGFLVRTTGKEDGRCRILRLTEKGRAFHGDFVRIVRQVNDRMERHFSPEELAALKGYLMRVAKNLSEETEETE
ncbi:MAG: MarR family transcriptional regulator [Oscillospiraceae bacterium]|nr:MarR family transcriptional regulator [Oscillospiraceae bacterium]